MKKLFPTLILSLFFILSTFAQSTMPELRDWLDEEHYLEIKENDKGEKTWYQINAKSGNEKAYTPEASEDISDNLPSGVNASRRNSIYSTDRNKIIISQADDLYLFEKDATELRQLTATSAKENNPRFSPDGRYVAFTRERNLYVLDTKTGLEKQLTEDGSDLIYNGWASWVYYEEILGRGSRYRAFYWSPDSKKIAFLRFDDNPVPDFPIFHHTAGDGVHGELEVTRYPKSGDPNPLVELGIADVSTSEITWVDKEESLEYLAMVIWTPDSKEVLYQQLNRNQNHLVMYAANPETGAPRKVYEEIQVTWVDFFTELHFLENNKDFLLRSNKDGWSNLYLVSLDGTVQQITKADWRVTSLVRIDEANDRIFYKGTGENPTESHFFVTDLKGKKTKQLTKRAGTSRVNLSPGGNYFLSEFSSYDNPGVAELYNTDGEMLKELGSKDYDINKENGMKVEMFTIPTEDGYNLPAYWVLPPNFDESKKYPVIFTIYGGPDAGTVYNRYNNFTWSQIYKEGVIRFAVDHRASGKFGKKGLDYMHRSLGKWEMYDYKQAVDWLRKKPFIDGSKIGIQGSSYGGYMAALALCYAPDYFTHGVASASVTDWRLYDNIYTERYMDEPKDNKAGYDYGSVLTHAENLKGKLLIIHGTVDDNVHMQQTIQLVSELQDKGKDFDFMLYPTGRHGWGGAKRQHSTKLIQDFWRKHLLNDQKDGTPTKP